MRNLGAAQALLLASAGVAVLALMDALVKSLSGTLPTIEILFFFARSAQQFCLARWFLRQKLVCRIGAE